ncbi:APC family permease [Tsuneonella mangrovi]|uniref:APC family permease n=1 Tax=Tsuneonella mangrovi TaxID=1982042 RepID=UPI000BA20CBC|nr:amino acid permease [Tsuneonella mangrovi]
MEQSRPFGIWTATAVVVGTMIGAGIFVLPAALAPYGTTGTVSWIIAGAGAITIALVISAFAASRPDEPSTLAICGDILGLMPARLIAWAYWTSVWTSMSIVAITGAAYLLHLFPAAPQGTWANAILATAIIAIVSAANLRGAGTAGNLQVVTTLLKVIPLAVVIGVAAWLGTSSPQTFSATHVPSFSLALLTPTLAITFYAMVGFETAGLVAERVRDPARNVARATVIGVLAVLAIYWVVSTTIVYAVPTTELQHSNAPIADFVAKFVGTGAGDAVALFAAISAIGCLNGMVLVTGEIPLGLARDGQIPGWMAPTNSRDVADRPLLLGSILSIALILGSVTGLGERVLDFMLRLTNASAIVFYGGICIAAIAARSKPVHAFIGLGFCVWMLYGTGWQAGGLGMLLMAVAVPLHFLIGGRTTARGTAPA